ncbi:hypothetical protein [Luteimonas sp. 100069]|uniref:hypothetical protein n=1 Tax=Luteimonas sp. 100069 TaxID=2006109 RepID=UPI000F4DBEDB|nr:hypothetical protein [Luteimonas sp. 100069]
MNDRWIKTFALGGTCLLYIGVFVILNNLDLLSSGRSGETAARALEVVYVVRLRPEELASDQRAEPSEPLDAPSVYTRARQAAVRQSPPSVDVIVVDVPRGSEQANPPRSDSPRVSAASLLNSVQAAPIVYAERQPWDRDPALRRTATRERFRMREQVAIEDVVREVSRFLGFWPPGYTDSPCPGLRVVLNEVVARPDADPEFVREIALAKAKFCD